MNAHTTSVAPL